MGSWANSLHVRHNDAAAVADAIRTIVEEAGYRIDRRPHRPAAAGVLQGLLTGHGVSGHDSDADVAWEQDDLSRGVCIYQPVNGWVGILDSGDILELAQDLSAQLQTDTLLVMVHDSDSWYYELRRKDHVFDEFDSAGDLADDGDMSPELQSALERSDEGEIERLMERELLAHAPRGPIVMHDGSTMLPPEMALLRSRIQAGRATLADRLRYRWLWVRLMFRTLTGRMGPGGLRFGFDIPRTNPPGDVELRRHGARIHTIFPEANEAALGRLLSQNRFPAEDLLADFLAILGLPSLYAQLSFNYLEDFTNDDLAEEGIEHAAELRFTAP
jgi:hypothetical protein